MAIDPNEVKNVTDEAVRSGGVIRPIRGNDVLETDPSQLSLETLPQTPLEGLAPKNDGQDEYQVASIKNTIVRGIGKGLSPRSDTFNKVKKRFDELQQESEKTNNTLGTLDNADRSIQRKPDDVDDEGFGPGFDLQQTQNYESYEKGLIIRADGNDRNTFMEGLSIAKPPNEKGLLDDFRAKGARGDAKIPDEQAVLDNIQAVSYTYAGKIDEAKRGEIELETTRQLADILGMTPKRVAATILGRQRGGVIQFEGAGVAESMLAARDLLIREIKVLDGLAKKAEFGGDEDALQFRTQLELVGNLQAQIKGAQTELGRAVSAFRIPAREGQAAQGMKERDLTTLLDDYGGTDDIRDIAKAYNQQGDNIAAKAAIARSGTKFRKFTDAFYEAWINVLLSNPVTHMKNIIGAFLTTFAHIPETYTAATVGSIRRSLGGEGGVYFGEANAALFATVMSINEAFGAAAKTFKTGERILPGTKIEGFGGQRHTKAFSSEGFEAQGTLGTIADVAGRVLTLDRVPTRGLEFEDTFFKVIAHRQSLYQSAMGSGQSKGLSNEALEDHIAEFLFDPPKSALEKADAHAKYVTLQSELDKFGKHFRGLRSLPTARFFMPFLKTPYNAFKYAQLDRGPLGLFFGEGRRAIERARLPGASQADKAAGDMALGRLMLGNATMVSMGFFVTTGSITGNGPSEPGLRRAMLATGWQPYSIKIGNTYYSYKGAEPFSSTIMMAADAVEAGMSAAISDGDWEKISISVAASLGSQLTDKNFLQGISTLFKGLMESERYGDRIIKNFAASLVPRVLSQVERQIDPVVRQTRGLIDEALVQIPGFSSTLPPKRNLAGQSKVLGGALGPDILSPIYTSTVGPNPADSDKARAKQAFKMFQEIVDVKFNPSPHPEEFNKDLGLSPQEVDVFHQFCGKYTVSGMLDLFKDPEYQDLRKRVVDQEDRFAREQLHNMMRMVLQNARAQARDDLQNYDGPEGASIRAALDDLDDLRQRKEQMMQGN